jgi:formate hydrogenlyase subunit 3/multisubunit Na+/H+ antiporter MnhD subunit
VFAALFSPVVIVLLINPLNRFPWLVTDATVFELLTIGGLVTAVAGGLLAAPQNEPGRVLAYAAISDLGVLLIGLGTASSLGLTGALLDLCNRSLAVVLAGMGWVLLRRYGFASQQGDWRGAGWQRPIAALSFLVGGLSLAGMPFLGGFASRWMIFSALGREGSTTAVLLVLAGGGVALGCLRVGYELFRQRPRVTMRERAEPTLVAAILIGLMLVLLLQGLFPELALGPIVEVVQGFAFVH